MIKEVSSGKLSSAKGFANESRLLGALLGRGYNVSRVDLPHSAYDMVVETDGGSLIRIQVKTVSSKVSPCYKEELCVGMTTQGVGHMVMQGLWGGFVERGMLVTETI